MDTYNMYPTPYFRLAVWTEEVKVPKKDPSGSYLAGGGCYTQTISKEVIEQKWINSEGDSEWRPLETVFIEDRCTRLPKEDFDFVKTLKSL